MTKIFDVICIGAALIDIVAQVERHPLEDDEVFVSDLKLLSGGAAANTASACAQLGLNTAFIGKLGFNDEFGNKLIKDFKKIAVSTNLIKYSKEKSTGSAFVALNKQGDRRIYAHSGAANELSKDDIIEQEIASTKSIFLSSLRNLKPFCKAAKIGKKKGIPVILNPGMLIIDQGFKNIEILLENIDILILSQREFITLMNINEKEFDNKTNEAKFDKLFKLGIKVVIVTMGKNGATLSTRLNTELIPSIKVSNVVDTTGAGDAFSAGFIYRFVENISFNFNALKNNVKIANLVAGNCIKKLGARFGIPKLEL